MKSGEVIPDIIESFNILTVDEEFYLICKQEFWQNFEDMKIPPYQDMHLYFYISVTQFQLHICIIAAYFQ